jgi:hypothetical protein
MGSGKGASAPRCMYAKVCSFKSSPTATVFPAYSTHLAISICHWLDGAQEGEMRFVASAHKLPGPSISRVKLSKAA